MNRLIIDPERLDDMSNCLKAINNPVRIAILEMLQDKDMASVGEIQVFLNMGQPSVSNHLKILKEHKVISSKRIGKKVYYCLKKQKLENIIDWINKYE